MIGTANKLCPKCSAQLEAGDKFCGSCGCPVASAGTAAGLGRATSPREGGPKPLTGRAVRGATILLAAAAVSVFIFYIFFLYTPWIEDYYPKSGPAGSQVALKLKNFQGISDLQKVKVLYDGKPVQVKAVKEGAVLISLPPDARSGKIQIKKGWITGRAASFTVLEREIVPLLSQQLIPSNTPQVVSYGSEVKVVVPPGLLDKTRTLKISRVKNPPCSDLAGPVGAGGAYEISIEGMEALNGCIEIGVRYDPSLLRAALPAESQLAALRWHEEVGSWVSLPVRVDERENMLYMLTDHLTLFEWLVLGGVTAGALAASWAGEWLLNDVYLTPQGNFKILYNKKAIDRYTALNDSEYETLYPKRDLLASYQAGHPRFIQDLGEVFEQVYARYCRAGFKDPVHKPGWLWGIRKSPVIVKVDSYWSSWIEEPTYEKIFERLHLPAVFLSEMGKPYGFGRLVVAHELFHRFQAEYYRLGSMSYPSNKWWIEAAAEFAGQVLAWDTPAPGRYEGIKADFLSHPLNTRGKPAGWERDYEYAAFVFIEFLVSEGELNFKELVEYVAGGSPLIKIDEFLRQKSGNNGGLAKAYREFAAWTVFSGDSFLKSFPVVAFESDVQKSIAEKKDILQLVDTDALTVDVGAGGPAASASVQVFGKSAGKERSGSLVPVVHLAAGSKQELIVKGKEAVVFFLAVNTGPEDTALPVKIKLGEEEKEHTFYLKGNCTAKLWAVKINRTELVIDPARVTGGQPGKEYTFKVEASSIPKETNEVTFEWDFGDGRTGSTGAKSVRVADRKAGIELKHVYQAPAGGEKGEFTLRVTLKDKGRLLAKKEAKVALTPAPTAPAAADSSALRVYPCTVYAGDGLMIEQFGFVLLPKEEFFQVAQSYAGRPPTEVEKQESENYNYTFIYQRWESITKAVPPELLPQVADGRLWVLIHGDYYRYNLSGELFYKAVYDRGIKVSEEFVESAPQGTNPYANMR